MKINTKNKSSFSAISINRITAERFRVYSKSVSNSHSESIDIMIDFFEKTKITPKSEIMISFIKFQNYMMGRFDYIEEILRRMENEQLKPTHDMLKSLFDGTALKQKQEPLIIDKSSIKMTEKEWNSKEVKVSIEQYQNVIKRGIKDKQNFHEFLNQISKVEPTFGKPYFKVEVEEAELTRLKEIFK